MSHKKPCKELASIYSAFLKPWFWHFDLFYFSLERSYHVTRSQFNLHISILSYNHITWPYMLLTDVIFLYRTVQVTVFCGLLMMSNHITYKSARHTRDVYDSVFWMRCPLVAYGWGRTGPLVGPSVGGLRLFPPRRKDTTTTIFSFQILQEWFMTMTAEFL